MLRSDGAYELANFVDDRYEGFIMINYADGRIERGQMENDMR